MRKKKIKGKRNGFKAKKVKKLQNFEKNKKENIIPREQ